MDLFSAIEGHPVWEWLSEEQRPWMLMDSASESGLMQRVADLAKEAGSSPREGVDIDESKGPVFVHEGAHVGP